MKECLTCKCGGQSWMVYNSSFECLRCGFEVTILDLNKYMRALKEDE